MNGNGSEYIIDAQYPNTKGFLDALRAIKGPTAQFCLVHFANEGLTLKWEHESKAMQSGIFIDHALFSAFNVRQETSFSLPLNTLLNTLEVFAPGDLGALTIRYPGPEAELMLESIEPSLSSSDLSLAAAATGGEDPLTVTPTASIYARIRTNEETSFTDILDYFEDPCSYFIGPAALFKEAIDDVEWVSGGAKDNAALAIELTRDPAALTFSARKENKFIEVEFPVDKLSALSVSGPKIRCEYNYKHIKAVFANLVHPRAGDLGAVSKVAIDAEGKLKVTHMLRVVGAGPDFTAGDGASHPLATAATETQGNGGGGGAHQGVVVAQFALLSLFDEDETVGGVVGEELGHGF